MTKEKRSFRNIKNIESKNRGFGLLEVLMAVALTSLYIPPIFMLMYSIHPKTLMSYIDGHFAGGDFYDVKKDLWVDPAIYIESDLSTQALYEHVSKEELQGRSRCDIFGSSPLSQDTQISFTSLSLGVSTTSAATAVAALGNSVVVSYNSSSTTDPDVAIYDWNKETGSLLKKASLDTGPGIVDMKIVGFIAFVGNTSVKSQAQAISLEDPSSPKVLRDYIFSGANSTTKPITKKIYIYGNLLIVGTEKSTLPEISVFDIDSGTVVATIETGYGVNGFFVKDDNLFVLSPLDPEIDVYDLRQTITQDMNLRAGKSWNTVLPQKIYSYDAPGVLGNGRSFDLAGNIIFFGRSKGGDEFGVLGYTAPSSTPTTTSYITTPSTSSTTTPSLLPITSQKISASLDVIIADLKNIFFVTSTASKRLMHYIFDPSTHTLNFTEQYALADRVSGFSCSDSAMFLAMQSTSTPVIELLSHQ